MGKVPPEYYAEWYKKNKEKHLAYMKVKVECKCGKSVARNNYPRHCRGNFHKKWEASTTSSLCKCGNCKCLINLDIK